MSCPGTAAQFASSSRSPRLLADLLDIAGLFTGRRSSVPAAERGLAAVTFTSALVLLYGVIAGTVGVTLWFWARARLVIRSSQVWRPKRKASCAASDREQF